VNSNLKHSFHPFVPVCNYLANIHNGRKVNSMLCVCVCVCVCMRACVVPAVLPVLKQQGCEPTTQLHLMLGLADLYSHFSMHLHDILLN
jgi:hypothetical protein